MTEITSHILDTSTGMPARGVEITLMARENGDWKSAGSNQTNSDGRVTAFNTARAPSVDNTYKLVFATGVYFSRQGMQPFFPVVEITFVIDPDQDHYHVPLLLNPFGYSTYRGS